MDALRYIADTKDIPGEPTPSDPVAARAQRGPGSAVAADAEETGAHDIDDPVCTSCGNFLRDDEIEAGTCDDCDYESAMESIADERGDR